MNNWSWESTTRPLGDGKPCTFCFVTFQGRRVFTLTTARQAEVVAEALNKLEVEEVTGVANG